MIRITQQIQRHSCRPAALYPLVIAEAQMERASLWGNDTLGSLAGGPTPARLTAQSATSAVRCDNSS
jgi:hypothetical protein